MAKQANSPSADKPKVTVLKEFRDKDNFELVYEVGDEIDSFDADRIATLVGLGLVSDGSAKTDDIPAA